MSFKPILPFFLVAFMSCQKEDASVQTSPCQSPYVTLRRQNFIQDRPALVVQRSQKNGEFSFQIVPSYSTGVDEADRTPWGSCNLGTAFQKDSLKVIVSGYFLTSDLLETMNISPLPFEVTSMQLRN
ncbi:hypothetical protein IC229_24915 [Spirosoma sp. BT702]|uniref:Lipoprotein n=1 Tax=Spirosoma profusum TaxID=2771354 RepID=A0A926Y4Y0_9BACT|nr:hypothetical protein [Spirosoma profusum]MBD2703910.1 hypothetical protein [Spirosoma profusum]